jgi:predicted small integral membrane protein
MNWMVWTVPTEIFFVCIAMMLISMTVLEIVYPNVPRRGFLPMVTTRGDRLFIGLLSAAYVNLAWVGLTELDQWWGAGIGFVALAALMRWG